MTIPYTNRPLTPLETAKIQALAEGIGKWAMKVTYQRMADVLLDAHLPELNADDMLCVEKVFLDYEFTLRTRDSLTDWTILEVKVDATRNDR